MSDYTEKLKDPRWQKRRLEILERDKWHCQYCHESRKTLSVHHKKYLPKVDPWDYPGNLLITLCKDCHDNETTGRPNNEERLINALKPVFSYEDVGNLADTMEQMNVTDYAFSINAVLNWILTSPSVYKQLCGIYWDNQDKIDELKYNTTHGVV